MRGFPSLSKVTCWAVALLASAAAIAAHAAPIATRQTAFQIPFHIDPPRDPLKRPVEVQLYVSEDRGASWRLHGRVQPDQKEFVFRAHHDGEYWFLVRTKDQSGQTWPDKVAKPEMQVVVDTSLPTLQLNAVRGPAGEIVVRWQCSDPNLQPQNLKIDFQTTGAADLWQSLALDPARVQTAPDQCTGETIVWPKQSGEALTIRAEILDRAGNRAVAQTQVAAATQAAIGAFGQTATAALPTTPPSFASPSAPLAANSAAASGNASAAASNVAPWNAASSATVANSLPAATRWPASQPSQGPLTPSTTTPAVASTTPYVVERLPNESASQAAIAKPPAYTPPTRGLLSSTARSAQAPASAESDAGGSTIQPPLTDVRRDTPNPSPAGAAVATDAALDASALAGQQPRMVNSRTFQIDYDVGAVGAAAVRKVELWGTRDGGLHWTSYGADPDNVTPLAATVEGEGTYGFRILVQNAGGMIEFPPKSGDRPEIWVGVDLTRPTCRLTAIEQGQAEQAGKIELRWEAWDRAPAERPITLSYSDQPAGPWNIIATAVENNGHYTWQLDNRVAERIYVRLEMRDQAGNVEITQTTQPVMLDHLRPKGRIREVRPTLETSRGPRTYRFF
jgi:hypothetical protein